MSPVIEGVETLVELLSARAAQGGDRGYVLLDGDREAERLTFSEVELRARRLAAQLRERHPAGARALLMYPPGIDFLCAFFGCLYADLIAVPAYPPDPLRLGRTLPRLEAIVRDVEAALVLTTAEIASLGAAMPPGMSPLQRLPWYATDELCRRAGAEAPRGLSRARATSLAFVQYTSGSTSAPRGVLVSHGNLLHNLALMWSVPHEESIDAMVGWVPQFHDMGLVLNSLMPVYLDSLGVILSPLEFLREPVRWLRAISRYRAAISGGPNFAYDLCVRKIPPAQREGLDLRCWTVAVNSAEPVRAETMDRFVEAFAPAGFQRGALMPCYGMAETTLAVTLHRGAGGPRDLAVDGAALEQGRVRGAGAGGGRRLVSSGLPRGGMTVVIVDGETRRRRQEGEVGEVWVRGPSVAAGYLGKPELTEEIFAARLVGEEGEDAGTTWLRTGDLGFLLGGELYLTGRRKDLIILRGRNHYPQDLERSADTAHAAVRPGCVIAFSVEEDGGEQLVLVAEVQPGPDLLAVAAAITQRIAEEHDLLVHRVALLPPRALPKTSSGKLQRGACRAELLGGALPLLGSFGGEELLTAYLRARVAAVAGVAAAGVALDQPLAALGVDSLSLAELGASLERTLGRPVDLAGLGELGAPGSVGVSVRGLAARLGTGGAAAAPQAVAPAPEPLPSERDPAAASTIQEAIYRDHERLPGCHGITVGLRLLGEVSPGELRRSLSALSARHPLLRAAFLRHGGRLRRRDSAAPGADATTVVDGRALGAPALRALLAEEALRPFSPETGPLMRALLVLRGGGESLLLLSLHHLTYDAVTVLRLLSLLVAELAGAAPAPGAPGAARRRDGAPEEAGYDRFVAWERRYLASLACASDGARLRQSLDGAPLGVPLPHAAGRRVQRQVAAQLPAEGVARLAAARAVTPYTLLLSAYLLALSERLGRADLVVGSAVSLRDEPGLREVLGPVFGYVPVRAHLGGVADLDGALGRVGPRAALSLSCRRYPLLRLADASAGQAAGAAPSPVSLGLNVNFNFYDLDRMLAGSPLQELSLRGEAQLGALRVAHLPLADLPVLRPYDVNLGVTRAGGRLRLGLRYREDLLPQGEAEALLARVVAALGLPAEN